LLPDFESFTAHQVVLTTVSLINTIPSSHTSGFSPFKKLYGYAPNYSSFRIFYCTCFVLCPHVEHGKFPLDLLFMSFFSYSEGIRGYRCFNPVTQKFYVPRHVVFRKHMPFLFISSTTYSLTRSDLIRKDPFSEDSDSLSSQVPSTLDTLSHVRPICTHHSVGTDTLLSGTPEAPFSSAVPQTLFEIVDPPLRQSIHIYKSTELLDFDYSSSFTFFLTYIYCLSKHSSYKEIS
jgi:hypothetical protein